MGRLVKTTPAAQEQQEEKRTVVGTGAHGRLVKTGDVQRTSPAANTAKTPTAQSVYQKVLDEAMMKRAAADQKNKERGRKSYNRTHAQEVREITSDKTKKSITPIIKSAAAGYAADMVGAADTLLRAPSGLNYAEPGTRRDRSLKKEHRRLYRKAQGGEDRGGAPALADTYRPQQAPHRDQQQGRGRAGEKLSGRDEGCAGDAARHLSEVAQDRIRQHGKGERRAHAGRQVPQ